MLNVYTKVYPTMSQCRQLSVLRAFSTQLIQVAEYLQSLMTSVTHDQTP